MIDTYWSYINKFIYIKYLDVIIKRLVVHRLPKQSLILI